MSQVLLSIGSNQNDPHTQIASAFSKLQNRFKKVQFSSLYETQPVGGISQDTFINAAILLETDLAPGKLLDTLMSIERDAGRDRRTEIPNGPRNLDLDIILYGDLIIAQDDLSIPHPRFRQRRFVLQPMSEIAATFVDPVTGKQVSKLLDACEDTNWVTLLEKELVGP